MPDSRELASVLRGVLFSAAEVARGEFIAWSQFIIAETEHYDSWIGRGLCQGLSSKYLDCTKRGVDFTDEVNRDTLILNKSGWEQFTDLHNEIKQAAVLNGDQLQSCDSESRHLRDKFGLNFVGEHTFGNVMGYGSYSRAGIYCGVTTRYNTVRFPGHTMAAVAKPHGYHFFDPNIGIVRMKSNNMAMLFSTYFGHPAILKYYGHGKTIVLTVRSYS